MVPVMAMVAPLAVVAALGVAVQVQKPAVNYHGKSQSMLHKDTY